MRTKHFLTALCLPLAFAACTNDDFVSESNMLEGRGMIDVTLTAARSSYGADTKMSIDDKNQFLWEKDVDMIGAALVDGKIDGDKTVVDGNIYVNYPFTADADGNVSTFSGKSAMTQGLYFFYYEYQDVLNRQGLPMGKPNQVYDAASEKTALQQAAQYMRKVSPIVNLKDGLKYADAQTYNLNLKFKDLYTVVQVNIKSANIPEGDTPKVTKIKLDGKTETTSEESAFKVNAAINMQKVAGGENANVITLDKQGKIKEDEQTAALAELEKMIADHTIYGKQVDGKTSATSGAFELNVKGDVVLDAAKTTSLYILVPKGTYKKLELGVETSEGSYKRTIESKDGIKLADKIQPISADLNFAQDGTGNVSLPEDFTITSADDWTNAIKFMTEHAVGYLNKSASFTLTKDIAIESLPVFNLKIAGIVTEKEGSEGITARTLTLKKNYTISEENKNQFEFKNVNLAVESGATMTLEAQPENIKTELINHGTLNVSANLTNVIKNFGTLNVTANAKISGGLTNGQVENKDEELPAYVGKVNVAEEKTLTITGEALNNVNGTIAIAEKAMMNIQIASTNQANGKIEVNGILRGSATDEPSEPSATIALTNTGIIDNFGSLQAKVENDVKEGGKVIANGTFIIEKGSSAAGENLKISGGTVEVKDVNAFAKAQGDLNNVSKKYGFENAKVTTKVTNAKEYKDATAQEAKITDITLASGDWKLASSIGADASKIIAITSGMDAVKGLTLEVATLDVAVNLGSTSKSISVSTSGTGTSTVKTTATSGMVTINGGVNVGKGSTLVVEKGVTVNALVAGNVAEAFISGTLNVMPGAKMYFDKATVAKGANLNVKGNTNSADEGEFGVKITAEFSNSGVVTSEAGTSTAEGRNKTPGKVSQPKNEATGTFKGNAVIFTFS